MKMSSLSFSKSYASLIIFGIILTPIFNYAEVLALFSGSLTSQSVALSPVYVKVMKDIIFITIIMLGSLELCRRHSMVFNTQYVFFIIIVAFSALISTYFKDTLIIIAGIRWILPILIFPFIYRSVDTELQIRITKWMITLFLLGLLLQIAQLFLTKGWYGFNYFGLSKRNPGFYLIPSSMACFAALTMYYAAHYCTNTVLRCSVVFILAPLSIVFTASGTGLIALILFWSYFFYSKVKQKILVFSFTSVFIISLLLIMPFLTGRDDIFLSVSERYEILSDAISITNIIFSHNFGDATNTGVLLRTNVSDSDLTSFIADSTVSSIVYNSGMLSLFLFLGFLFKPLLNSINNLDFYLLILPFFLTTVIFELFPANILLIVNIAYFYSYKKQIIHS